MPEPEYPIETERLHLRRLDPERDVDALHVYHSRPDVCRYIPFEPRTREVVAERIASPDFNRATLEKEGQALWLAVALKDTDVVVGDVVLIWSSDEHRGCEIGYMFNPDHHGRGYATEAARALLDVAFDVYDFHRAVARIDARNHTSAAVLRRVGMREEAHLIQNEWFKGEWTDEIDFAVLADEWRAARA